MFIARLCPGHLPPLEVRFVFVYFLKPHILRLQNYCFFLTYASVWLIFLLFYAFFLKFDIPSIEKRHALKSQINALSAPFHISPARDYMRSCEAHGYPFFLYSAYACRVLRSFAEILSGACIFFPIYLHMSFFCCTFAPAKV